MTEQIDHLVYATPDLDAGIAAIEALLGVGVTPGGQHPAWGTRNALVSLGPTTYLEIIAPDPAQPPPAEPRPFGLDRLAEPRLVTWAARVRDIDLMVMAARAHGVDLGAVRSGSRRRPDGVTLSWRLTDMHATRAGGVIPFLIDWGDSPHPAASLPRRCTLVELRAQHPESEEVSRQLDSLGLPLRVDSGAEPRLIGVIRVPNGRVELK